VADAVHDENILTHLSANTAGRYLAVAGAILVDTTITGTPSSTSFDLTGGSTVDGFYEDQELVIMSGTGVGQAKVVDTYTGATKTVTVAEAFAVTPASGDQVVIRSHHVHAITDVADAVRTEMDANSTQFAAIVGDIAALNDFNPAVDTVTLANGAHGGAAASFLFGAGGEISKASGTALIVQSNGGNGDGIQSSGNGTGAGARFLGGAAGVVMFGTQGLEVEADGGHAISAYSSAGGDGIHAEADNGDGIEGLSNAGGVDIQGELGALAVDTRAEVGQETPAATQTVLKMVQYLYKAWRNRSTQTATAYSLYADDATTVDQKATVSDDGTTFDSGEKTTGP